MTQAKTQQLYGAAAKYLKEHEAQLPGTVKLIFQPAEEGGAGAKLMVDEGALQGASAVFALHVWPTAPSGVLETRVSHFTSVVHSLQKAAQQRYQAAIR